MKLKFLLTSATAAMVFASSALAGGTVGIAMPTKSSSRWISDGNSMVEQFAQGGYETDLQYAEDDIPNQLAQIENMITKGVDVLVIAAIDGTTLSNALENANAAGIKVIAYDRLIRDSGNVDYYATFDNFKVGVQQATSLVDGMKERFGDKVKFRRYGVRKPFWSRFGAALAQDAVAGLEERAAFARFGL